jgi:hypothetical protein
MFCLLFCRNRYLWFLLLKAVMDHISTVICAYQQDILQMSFISASTYCRAWLRPDWVVTGSSIPTIRYRITFTVLLSTWSQQNVRPRTSINYPNLYTSLQPLIGAAFHHSGGRPPHTGLASTSCHVTWFTTRLSGIRLQRFCWASTFHSCHALLLSGIRALYHWASMLAVL